MKILREWFNLTTMAFGMILLFFFLVSIFENEFNFSNFFAKFLVLVLILIVVLGIFRLILWDKVFRSQDIIIMFLNGIFLTLILANIFFRDYVYKIQKEYIGISARETDDEDYFINTDYGERGEVYEYRDYYYLDPTIKSFVVKKNSSDYTKIKNTLAKNNEYIGEERYIYWQSAVVNGFYSKNSTNFIEKGFYYFLELSQKTIPSLILVLILNFIVQLLSHFKYSLLGAIYQQDEIDEEYDDEWENLWDEDETTIE